MEHIDCYCNYNTGTKDWIERVLSPSVIMLIGSIMSASVGLLLESYYNDWNNKRFVLKNLLILYPHTNPHRFDYIIGYDEQKNSLRSVVKEFKRQKKEKKKQK